MAPPDIGSTPNKAFQRSDGTRNGSTVHADQKTAGIKIRADLTDVELQDMADSLSNRLMLDGGNFSADIPASGQKFTGVGNATARTHFAAAGQIADGALIYAGTSAGTDTITASLSPAITAYVGGMLIAFRAGGTNTGAATLNINSVGAADIKKGPAGTTALAAGDITTGGLYLVAYNGTTSDFELLNAKFPDGFATTDTPQFTAINIGAASDTTLSRASAGDLQIETNIIYRAGGTDVAIADGGTGASTAADAFTALKQAASDTATGVLEIAVQSEMETGTSTTLAVTPGRQHFHPGHPKAGGNFNGEGTPAFRAGDYGMGAITDNGVGDYTLAIDTAFANTNYWQTVFARDDASANSYMSATASGAKTTTAFQVQVRDSNNTNQDTPEGGITFWGDYA